MNIRNICIIAHVDHGKTTLVDFMLQQAGTFGHGEGGERVMDSMDLERERGITIAAKNASIRLGETKVNIVDTPGHADFGGEVERIMGMVDGAILLVDAAEGPLPQTRFVLERAIQQKLKICLVINKVDRPEVQIEHIQDCENKVFDLFAELGASDDQMDFPILYACARAGWATDDIDKVAGLVACDDKGNLEDLFRTIVDVIPPPAISDSPDFTVQVANLGYSEYVGQLAIGRILSGTAKKNQTLYRLGVNDKGEPLKQNFSAVRLYTYEGLKQVETEALTAGDIAIIAGCEEFTIGDTITSNDSATPMTRIEVERPTLAMIFSVNTSPLSGQEGEAIMSRKLREILQRFCRTNVALKLEDGDAPDQVRLLGRGELQFAILLEQMRREGYEFMVGRPEVLFKTENGERMEPFERAVLDLPEQFSGDVTDMFQKRKGILASYENLMSGENAAPRVRLTFEIPTRGLLGIQSRYLTTTRGEGLFNSEFIEYRPHKGDIAHRTNGSLIADRAGEAILYSLSSLEERGVLHIEPGTTVYEGMIIGEHSRENDLNVNPCKEKKLTNVRSTGSDGLMQLQGIKKLSLEQYIEWIDEDEWIEITPEHIRVRKKILPKNMRSVRREDRIQ